MGCGHSKINIYPKKVRNKTSSKKPVTPVKAQIEEEESIENESELGEKLEDCDRKTIRVKPVGGPLLAQVEISSSQQNFFKMLDEKIESGPDYDSSSETEKAAEANRLTALLRDWETASLGSRSLPVTPKRRQQQQQQRPCEKGAGFRSAEVRAEIPRSMERPYNSHISQSVIHQSYGVAQVAYRQTNYNPVYQTNSPSHQPHSHTHPAIAYPSALQYQALSPMYTSQPTYQVPPKQYSMYNQHGSPIKSFANNSPKHIPYEQSSPYSPGHKLYGSVAKQVYSNGELIQQQIYNQQLHYQQNREQQQFKQPTREQLIQQQQQGLPLPRSYQSSVHIPMIVSNQQNENNSLHKKQYELT